MGPFAVDTGMYKLINATLQRLKKIFKESRKVATIAPLDNGSQPTLAELAGTATATPPSPTEEFPTLNIYTVSPVHVEQRQFQSPPPMSVFCPSCSFAKSDQ